MDDLSPRTFDPIEHSRADHARVVLVDWMLGNNGSYACSYCPKSLHDGSVRWQSVADVLAFYDLLQRHYAQLRGKRVWLQFTGGEPTMHPQIIRLLEAATACGFQVSLILERLAHIAVLGTDCAASGQRDPDLSQRICRA